MSADDFSIVLDPPVIADLRLRALREYWDRQRQARAMPRRSDIDPLQLRSHLPNIFLFDALEDPPDFRFRLVGTAITATYGRDSTGSTIRELYWPANAALGEWTIGALRQAVIGRRPVLASGPLRAVHKDFIAHVSLILPLAEDGETVNMLLGETHFLRPGD